MNIPVVSGAEKPNSVVGDLAIRYAEKPGIRALLKLLPGGGAADGLLQSRADEIKRERLRDFFDELAIGDVQSFSDLESSNEFVHCFLRTSEAVMRTNRKEKIAVFAQMLKGSLKSGSFSSLDEYEELLEVVDGLSYRQFVALRRLSEYENEFSNVSAEKDKHHMELYWDKYRSEITNTLGIAEADFESFMTRLESSGLYARQIGGWGANPSLGNTTGVFRKLIDLVEGD